jgi:hypothetical protein
MLQVSHLNVNGFFCYCFIVQIQTATSNALISLYCHCFLLMLGDNLYFTVDIVEPMNTQHGSTSKIEFGSFFGARKGYTRTKSHVGAGSWAGHNLTPLGSPRLEVTSELSPLDKSFKMRTCENSLKR